MESNPNSETLKEISNFHNQTKSQASLRAKDEEPPKTEEPIKEETETPPEPVEAPSEEAPKVEAPAPEKEEEELIVIGGQVFKTQSEAIKYAEQLAREKEIAEAHAAGAHEAIRALRPQEEKPQEDNFEEKFYTDPKGTLEGIKKSARDEAIAFVKQEAKREEQWKKFFDENPDLEGERELCEQELYHPEKWNMYKNMEVNQAMKVLATKVRARFQAWEERKKPRKELPSKGGQVVSHGSNHVTSHVTSKKSEAPLDFAAQLRKIRGGR